MFPYNCYMYPNFTLTMYYTLKPLITPNSKARFMILYVNCTRTLSELLNIFVLFICFAFFLMCHLTFNSLHIFFMFGIAVSVLSATYLL